MSEQSRQGSGGFYIRWIDNRQSVFLGIQERKADGSRGMTVEMRLSESDQAKLVGMLTALLSNDEEAIRILSDPPEVLDLPDDFRR